MKLNWNFLGGGGVKQNVPRGEYRDIFWNFTMQSKCMEINAVI